MLQLFKQTKNTLIKPIINTVFGITALGLVTSCNQDEKQAKTAENTLAKIEKIDTAELLENFKKDQKTHNDLVKFVQDNIDQDKNDTITTYEFKRMKNIVEEKSKKNEKSQNLITDIGYGAFEDFKIKNAKGEIEIEMKHNDIHINSLSNNEKLDGKTIIIDGKEVYLSYQSNTVHLKYN